MVVVWYRVIIVSALSLSLRDKERFRDWEIERAWQNLKVILDLILRVFNWSETHKYYSPIFRKPNSFTSICRVNVAKLNFIFKILLIDWWTKASLKMCKFPRKLHKRNDIRTEGAYLIFSLHIFTFSSFWNEYFKQFLKALHYKIFS